MVRKSDQVGSHGTKIQVSMSPTHALIEVMVESPLESQDLLIILLNTIVQVMSKESGLELNLSPLVKGPLPERKYDG